MSYKCFISSYIVCSIILCSLFKSIIEIINIYFIHI